MSKQHPSPAILSSYANGSLPPAFTIVVTSHLHGCQYCRREVAFLERAGGAAIENAPQAEMSPGAVERVMRRFDEPESPLPQIVNEDLPEPLARLPAGRWWPVWRGVKVQRIRMGGPGLALMVSVQPGRAFLPHVTAGLQIAHVLSGAHIDEHGRYDVGDFEEIGPFRSMTPKSCGEGPCVTVMATEGFWLKGIAGWIQRALGLWPRVPMDRLDDL